MKRTRYILMEEYCGSSRKTVRCIADSEAQAAKFISPRMRAEIEMMPHQEWFDQKGKASKVLELLAREEYVDAFKMFHKYLRPFSQYTWSVIEAPDIGESANVSP